MADMVNELAESLARVVRDARGDLSVAELANRSGVSRAMIGKIERAAAHPTAVLLGRLSAALGLTLSELVARAEAGDAPRLLRAADQPRWTDPDTGYRRRAISPAAGRPLELVEVELPAGAAVSFTAGTYAGRDQQIWVLDGHLRFHEGDLVHELDPGDCLALGPPERCTVHNPTGAVCRYLVALSRRARPVAGVRP